jgi:hypothetical protein
MNDNTLNETDLAYFTGTTNWYQHSLTTVVYTDGVQFMAERGKAYWLIDEIATSQMIKHVHQEPFQVWILKVQEKSATLTCEDGNDRTVYVKKIPYTNFPLPEIKLYFVDNVMMLPSEY